MDKTNICIATITWARSEEEEITLRTSLQKLAGLHIPVFVTDGGSGGAFLDFLRSIPHFTLLQTGERGVFAQAKNSVQKAFESGRPFIFYTEPDKEVFYDALPNMLSDINMDVGVGIYMPSRSAADFATFPLFQQMTETTINNCCAEIIGKEADYTYGPFLFDRALAPYLTIVNEDIGWGWRPYLFCIAHRLGHSLQWYTAHFPCPIEQRRDDAKERVYRMRQLEQNIRGIVLSSGMTL